MRCTSRPSFFVIENTSFHHWNNTKGISQVPTGLKIQQFNRTIEKITLLWLLHL